MFFHTVSSFKDTLGQFREAGRQQLAELFSGVQQVKDCLSDLIIPLADLDLNINNETFCEYDKAEVFIADFLSLSKKFLKQWKVQLQPAVFQTFLENFASTVTLGFKRVMMRQEISLLGAMFLDKVALQFKNFLQQISGKPVSRLT
mmetsp:Transcript_19051/g.13827  ORF Transcript_19051/g.13827 Transcript_19051/m.13827 type:complete len:146 (-) Transcript_19051:189-626(-)